MNAPPRPSLLERLSALILREPGDREQLAQLLRSAYSRNLLDADAMSIIEGALTVSEMQVRDIMIPRAQVDFIDINEPVENFIPQVMATAHSRFPVIDQNRDDVPDGDPVVLLSGFGMEDAQSLANHLTWGPDGWLYGLNGSTTTCRIRGVEFQQGVWRYHPSGPCQP